MNLAVALIEKRKASVLLQDFSATNCAPAAAIPVVSPPRVYQELATTVSERKKRENLSLRQFLYP